MQNLEEKAMLVRLSISQWSARKHDKTVTQKVEKEYNAQDSGRYNKVLIAKESIKEIKQAADKARGFHYDNTLPWNDLGDRILPAANFDIYRKEMSNLKNQFEAKVKTFLENYPDYVEQARLRLNGMFNEADYPKPQELGRRFNFDTFFDPLPKGEDFRVSIGDEEARLIQQEIEERLRYGQTAALKDLWSRLYNVVSCMTERLGDDKKTFRNSLVTNIQSLVKLLPRLNIGNDLSLDKARREIEAQLCQHAPQTLRESKALRQEVADKAESIKTAMSGYMTP